MVVAQSPISGHQRPRSGRKALQPKNSFSFDTKATVNFAAAVWGEAAGNNKENILVVSSIPVKKECSFEIDASLAEELSAIREKLERLRIDKEKTDGMLRERSLLLDSQMKEMVDRGMLQKHLEIEVDRLFRLKEIKLSCTVCYCIYISHHSLIL